MKYSLSTFAIFVLFVLAGLMSDKAFAELFVALPCSDNAVFQRDMPVPIWGKADADTTVTVKFAGQTKTGQVDTEGRWQVDLDPIVASFDPAELTITSSADGQKLVIKNILVGEVWICSGQSNMQMEHQKVPAVKALIPSVKNIRKLTIKQTVAFTEQDTCQGQWQVQHPDSAVAFAFAYFLEQAAEVPVGIVQTCWGSSSIEGWMPRDMTESLPHFQKQMQAFDADQEKQTRIKSILDGPKPWGRKNDIFLRIQPNVIYNAIMHPLAPMACRGIVWYQGEANAKNVRSMLQYGETLPAWIQRYREEWGREDLHFMVVMMPGYAKGLKDQTAHPAAPSWAWMRESQLNILNLPHTSVANTIDLGMVNNIHPTDKLPIGKRLALLAARDTLDQEVVASGPVINRVEPNRDQLVVHFFNATGLRTLDGNPPAGFWISGDSEEWVKAETVLSGETVVLSARGLAKPRFVRYAFAGKPAVNLVNGADLPARPFRTDSFKPQ
jgi:sialate O-acetylesterase